MNESGRAKNCFYDRGTAGLGGGGGKDRNCFTRRSVEKWKGLGESCPLYPVASGYCVVCARSLVGNDVTRVHVNRRNAQSYRGTRRVTTTTSERAGKTLMDLFLRTLPQPRGARVADLFTVQKPSRVNAPVGARVEQGKEKDRDGEGSRTRATAGK